ncbi:MAG: peptide chain release factor N(5)-glutamine methyltransferase [Lachnospiraceae bacterium]|jgi:release factor glutamine methyltransferase|nr:peptide chain release factor N(5)-glutamine methyltransferase [Lachnospiraceae bacterium]MEE3460416.1 peptide chain release factor N(5)-glutamine methyltransferase [Lachnospiraceae bacterium]
MTWRELLNEGKTSLKAAGISDHDTDAFLLLSYVSGYDRGRYMLHEREHVPDDRADAFRVCIEKRESHIPLQHITGVQNFYGYDFLVTPDVLIPRQETEELAELAISFALNISGVCNILDLCTGSGCIAVTVKKELDKRHICSYAAASDISDKALFIAGKNAEKNKARITFIKSDMFENIDGRFDIIISNPPYIPTDDIYGLDPEVKDCDPWEALDGGQDGLLYYRIIAEEAKAHLNDHGLILLEIGYDQGSRVAEIFSNKGFPDISIRKDISGNDRFAVIKMP